ncbi:LysR substrate-binding domain-containing protein [Microvirga terricola]|uniref:LysR substrate-binding domain-containing protein n=1 Tax=Microvirga terricola TaxID=2719797 RepID=UPI0031B9E439
MAEYARRIEAEAFAIERVALACKEDVAAEVSVSAPPVIATSLIGPRLQLLKESYPHLRLRLLGESRTVSLPRREADIALRLTRPDDMSLVMRKVGTITYGLYASSEYLASRREEDFEFIAFDESLDDVPQQVWLKKLAGERPIVFRTNDLAIQCTAAQAHVGIAALPGFVGCSYGLQRADLQKASISRDVWLTFHRDLRDNFAVASVAGFLADCLRPERTENQTAA